MAYEIVGVGGTSASGKDTAAERLAELGFLHVSTAEIIRAEAVRLYGSTDQHVLRKVGHEMRTKNGPGAVVLHAISTYYEQRNTYRGVVVGSIRALGPAQAIKDEGGLLISTDGPARSRYSRLVSRGRVGESTSFEEFTKYEEEELNGSLNTGQNVRGVAEISDVRIWNDGTLEEFLRAIDVAVGIAQLH